MIRRDATAMEFEITTLFDKRVLFSEFKIERTTVPKGLYMYEIRHANNDNHNPIEINGSVFINFYGTILSKDPIPGQAINSEEDFSYEGYLVTVREYMEN